MTEHEQNLRDLAALVAMAALLVRDKYSLYPHDTAFKIADQFINERKKSGSNIQDEWHRFSTQGIKPDGALEEAGETGQWGHASQH